MNLKSKCLTLNADLNDFLMSQSDLISNIYGQGINFQLCAYSNQNPQQICVQWDCTIRI